MSNDPCTNPKGESKSELLEIGADLLDDDTAATEDDCLEELELDGGNDGALEEDEVLELTDFLEDDEDEDTLGSKDCDLEDACNGGFDCADKQSTGQALGFFFSNSSQTLSPHWPASFCCLAGLGGCGGSPKPSRSKFGGRSDGCDGGEEK